VFMTEARENYPRCPRNHRQNNEAEAHYFLRIQSTQRGDALGL
jgi:hypothetical protein